VGQFGPNRPERIGPDVRISKETTWAIKVNRAEMKNRIERSVEKAFEFKQGFFSKFKDSNTIKLNLN
jgi:hypothetical protein